MCLAYTWRLEDLQELVLCFYHVDSGDPTQVIKLVRMHLFLLIHLTLRELGTMVHLFFQRLQTQLSILIQKPKKKSKTKFVLAKIPDQQQTGIVQTNQDLGLSSLPSWGTIPE